ncbi:MAG TPA: AMP-binding protein [Vicinamibacterales bacterium]|nr:AMP-binding protein [Vicinamibacterales bacterium]
MADEQGRSAHVDQFVRERLPPPDLWPRMDWSGVPELAYPDHLNCTSELLDRWIATGEGERVAFRHAAGAWSYRRLFETANRIANVLVEDLGVVPGNRVLLRATNQPMLVACWFAVLKAGAVAVSTMPLLRVRELTEVCERADVRLALTDVHIAGDLETAMQSRPNARVVPFNSPGPGSLDALMAARPATFDNVLTAADDPAIIAFTSGTTGRAKGTVHFHRDILAVTDTYGRYVLRPEPDDIFIGSPPLAFTYALGCLVLFPMRFGASTALLEQASPPHLLAGIEAYRATVTVTSPTAYRAMLKQIHEFDVSSLRKGVSAGETLPAATFDAWLDATGVRLMDGIGSTEMLHVFIGCRPEHGRSGSTGRVVPGYRAMVVDEQGQEVPRNTVGRLAVKGPTGCRYLDDLDNQRRYVQHGWNFTGDAYLVDDEGYFWYQARTDDMIISSGYNISGPEIENVLLTDPAVAECAVIGVPDAARGQIVKAFVVPAAGREPSDGLARHLQEFVKSQLAPYKYPRAITFMTALPRTLTGKVQRFKLRDEARNDAAGSNAAAGRAGLALHQPDGWDRPVGYSNAVSASGRMVFVAGQIGWNPATSRFEALDLCGQIRQALSNVVAALAAAGARPDQITRLTWYVTDRDLYLSQRAAIGQAYREIIGRHFPAMSMVVVNGLIEPDALVEIEATAVVSRSE